MSDTPTLFDTIPVTARPAASSIRPRPNAVRRKPIPLSSPDDPPGTEARFDVLFTHDQMMTLNAATATFYQRWGVRVNKSQVLRALVAALRQAEPNVEDVLERARPDRLFKAPPKAAPADVHRRFEARLAELLTAGIVAAASTR